LLLNWYHIDMETTPITTSSTIVINKNNFMIPSVIE
jgi:hypothetical protein